MFLGSLAVLWASTVWGQACCSGGSPVSGVLGVTAMQDQSIKIMATYDQHFMNRLYNGADLLETDKRRRRIHNLIVEGSYGLSDRFALSTMFSFVRQARTIRNFDEEQVTTLHGVGDAFMLLKYQLLNQKQGHPTQIVLGAGPKFPLGRNDVTGTNGLLLAPDLQPGTGSWDILTWAYASRSNFLNSGLNLAGYFNYRITTPTTRANSDLPYKYGNEFQANVGVRKALTIGEELFTPSLFTVYRNLASDRVDNDKLSNTGGNWVYAKPGITWSMAPEASLRVATDIPVYQKLNGTQLGSTFKLQISFNYTIQ